MIEKITDERTKRRAAALITDIGKSCNRNSIIFIPKLSGETGCNIVFQPIDFDSVNWTYVDELRSINGFMYAVMEMAGLTHQEFLAAGGKFLEVKI